MMRETGDSETEEERYRKIKRDDMDWTDKAGYDSDRMSHNADSYEVAGHPDLGNFADRIGDRGDHPHGHRIDMDKAGDHYDRYTDIGKDSEEDLDKFADAHDGIGEVGSKPKKVEKKEEKKEEKLSQIRSVDDDKAQQKLFQKKALFRHYK